MHLKLTHNSKISKINAKNCFDKNEETHYIHSICWNAKYSSTHLYNSPSILSSSCSTISNLETELQMRIESCTLIELVAQHLNMPQTTLATASYYLHNFYMNFVFEPSTSIFVASACLYLASKIDECRYTPLEILSAFVEVVEKLKSKEKFLALLDLNSFDLDNVEMVNSSIEQLLKNELRLLRSLDYSVLIDLPYRQVLSGIKRLMCYRKNVDVKDSIPSTNINKLCSASSCLSCCREFCRNCFAIVNKSFKLPVMLFYPPQHIALASIHIFSLSDTRLCEIHDISSQLQFKNLFEEADVDIDKSTIDDNETTFSISSQFKLFDNDLTLERLNTIAEMMKY